ncbi:MAG TPA: hypothetical protein VGC78_08345 [Gaiellaceae bacterium]
MSLFRRDPDSHLGDDLRHARPTPRQEFADDLATRIERQIPSRITLKLRAGVAVALTAALAVVAASFGGVGYAAYGASHAVKAVVHTVAPTTQARHDDGESANSAAKHQYHKVKLCHEGHTIEVGQDAVAAHLAHGDTLGPCRGDDDHGKGIDDHPGNGNGGKGGDDHGKGTGPSHGPASNHPGGKSTGRHD